MAKKRKRLYDRKWVKATVEKLASDIAKTCEKEDLCVIGIRTGGAHLADRVVAALSGLLGKDVPMGLLDITFYRDDIASKALDAVVKGTEIPFNIDGKTVVLVDDVLYTGRTVRAALNEIMDFGRAGKIRLLVLVDRGHREIPIAADYVGSTIQTKKEDRIKVAFSESGGEDEVFLEER